MTTTSYFLSREQFLSFHDQFKARAHARQLTSTDILLYNLIRDLPLTRGFSSITNATKLANGATPTFALDSARSHLQYLLRRPDKIKALYSSLSDDIIAQLLTKLQGA